MMNHRVGPHHNMWTSAACAVETPQLAGKRSNRRSEGGYTLVALLALMTVLAIFALAAAPSIRQQAQREREIEAIFRGEQVADAIRTLLFLSSNPKTLLVIQRFQPPSINFLKAYRSARRKFRYFAPSAAHDPLSESGEWRLVRPRSTQLADFQRSVMLFAGNVRPPTNDPQLKRVEQLMAPPVIANDWPCSSGSSSSERRQFNWSIHRCSQSAARTILSSLTMELIDTMVGSSLRSSAELLFSYD